MDHGNAILTGQRAVRVRQFGKRLETADGQIGEEAGVVGAGGSIRITSIAPAESLAM